MLLTFGTTVAKQNTDYALLKWQTKLSN